jgi:hypothetical protein
MAPDDKREPQQIRDEVLREVREIKGKLAAVRGFDVGRIMAEARANQAKSRRKIIPVPVRERP